MDICIPLRPVCQTGSITEVIEYYLRRYIASVFLTDILQQHQCHFPFITIKATKQVGKHFVIAPRFGQNLCSALRVEFQFFCQIPGKG